MKSEPTDEQLLDLLCEVVSRLVIEVGMDLSFSIVADLDMTEIQRRAAQHALRMLGTQEEIDGDD